MSHPAPLGRGSPSASVAGKPRARPRVDERRRGGEVREAREMWIDVEIAAEVVPRRARQDDVADIH
jgi:hypothetical protein